ncbi:tetratricopeptide repeat protein [Streptomyces acidiscabies]|uniref:tetratricopeptide repeat protein n=1 Tax=Streptomyces acidiscabies TaxID=42234 RepID=UPI000959B105|nr:tetratricopeptide repeat protein [Streptomyces acidiscabies]GAV40796.1 regulatory protein AfsR [Streptomyces acidiscabies]
MNGDHIDFRGGTFYGPVYGKVEGGGASAGAVSMLPGAPAGFTGREAEVAAVLGALEVERVVCLSGLAGVGKTALAVAVAHAARERGMFPGGVLFVDLRGDGEVPVSAEQAVSSLLWAMGVREGEVARYRSELASREAMLVVLDNAGGGEQVVPLLPGEGAGHRVLVTSRDVLGSFPVRSVEVEALSGDAGRELIERALPGDPRLGDGVRELVEVCGGLPLALVIVAALLRRRRGLGVRELVAELEGDRVGLLAADGVDQYGKSLVLRPVLDAMYRRLGEGTARIFRGLGVAPGKYFDSVSGQMMGGVGAEGWRVAADELVAASLISALPGGGGWQMHDLVRAYAGALVTEEEAGQARMQLQVMYYARLTLAYEVITKPDQPQELFPGGPEEALSWFETERLGMLNSVRWGESEDRQTAVLALKTALALVHHLRNRRAFDDMLDVATIARDTARRLGAGYDETVALGALSTALIHLRRFEEGLDACREELELCDRVGNLEGRYYARSGIAVALLRLGRLDEALDARERALVDALALDDPSYAALARAQFAATLGDCGRPEEAYEALSLAIPQFEELGMRHQLAEPLYNMAQTLRSLGRPDEALPHAVRSLRISTELNDWRGKADSWGLIGLILRESGRRVEAVQALTRSLEWSELLGDEHQAGIAWLGLSAALTNLKRYHEAIDASRAAIEFGTKFEEWSIVGDAGYNLGISLHKVRRKGEARVAFGAAADAYERGGMPEQAAKARRLAGGS